MEETLLAEKLIVVSRNWVSARSGEYMIGRVVG